VATDPGFAGAPAAGPGLTMTTTEQQGPGLMAAVTAPGDNGWMALTSAERQARRRARQKAGESLPSCSSCGAQLQPDLRQRLDRVASGLCWACWLGSPAGLEAERLRGKRTRGADLERARMLGRERARRFRAKASQSTEGGQAKD
jgi:hypothetical protein